MIWVLSKKKFTKATNAAKQGVVTLINNTMDDLHVIYDDLSACAAELDNVRTHVTNRAIEYYTAIQRAQIDAGLIPVKLVEEVIKKVAPQLIRDPHPGLFQLVYPRGAVWGGEHANFVPVTHASDINSNRDIFMFVHGMSYGHLEK